MITNDPSTWERSIVEAPWLIKHAGWYYLFYSGAGGASYAVGVARAPAIAGPYTKHGPPLLHTNTSSVPFQGTGHWCGREPASAANPPPHGPATPARHTRSRCSSVITDARTGNLAIIYHAWYHGRCAARRHCIVSC